MLAELTVAQLRWIISRADDHATIPEALEEFAANERREAADAEHIQRARAYEEYMTLRREREHESVQAAARAAKESALAAAPISRERLSMVISEAADVARLRFELHEPQLEFQEWLDAGEPGVHRTGHLRDKLTGAAK